MGGGGGSGSNGNGSEGSKGGGGGQVVGAQERSGNADLLQRVYPNEHLPTIPERAQAIAKESDQLEARGERIGDDLSNVLRQRRTDTSAL